MARNNVIRSYSSGRQVCANYFLHLATMLTIILITVALVHGRVGFYGTQSNYAPLSFQCL